MAGLFRAILDAIQGEDESIAGQAISKLSSPLSASEVATMLVESTIGFGENTDGAGDAKVLVGGEVVTATGRTTVAPFSFTTLTRGVEQTTVKMHPTGTLVYDLSRNATALDRVRRGLLVNFALGEDLDVIGRNLGLRKCVGLTESQWRDIIKAVAYLPKQTIDAFNAVLTAFLGSSGYTLDEHIITDPFKVFVQIAVLLSTSLRGRFVLNGQEPQLTTGLTTVLTDYPINNVIGVYLDNLRTRRGNREGETNYYSGGSFVGSTITLGLSPGAIGTAVLVDYGAFTAHYLAPDETERDALDFYAYLADPTATVKCLLDQIRAAGVQVNVTASYS